jgi:AcrR family transcriptional regulator
MSPRQYRMGRRAESADQTRRRIVEATIQLHGEKGIAATTLRDIARRADVALGTVYNHFPTYDDVITACGALTWELLKPPTIDIMKGVEDPQRRIALLVRELFSFYARYPKFGRARSERHLFNALDEGFRQEEKARTAMIDAAFRGTGAGKRTKALAFALLDFSAYENMLRSGLSHAAAVDEVTTLLLERTSQ